VLAPRRLGIGPQGRPVNRSAAAAGVLDSARDPRYRLVVDGRVTRPLALSLDELRGMPQHEAILPIACVEGWSYSARWRGIRVRDLLHLAGARPLAHARVESLESYSIYGSSPLNRLQAHDPDTLLALELDGNPLAPDHGYPLRLIGPNRPGVDQTKWVHRLVVL
jgi:DMSO/TMAO reductase YedYZ molybdopterin-dependent catalytic subunit